MGYSTESFAVITITLTLLVVPVIAVYSDRSSHVIKRRPFTLWFLFFNLFFLVTAGTYGIFSEGKPGLVGLIYFLSVISAACLLTWAFAKRVSWRVRDARRGRWMAYCAALPLVPIDFIVIIALCFLKTKRRGRLRKSSGDIIPPFRPVTSTSQDIVVQQ